MNWIQRLRIRQLYVLAALHETGNLSLTAERLHMTQPALSKWLRELESDLEVELFERHSKGLIPTQFCDMLVIHARAVMGELERSEETLAAVREGLSGQLIVGTSPTDTHGLLPSCIAEFRRMHPGICIAVHENSVDKLLPLLMEGRLDFVIGRIDAAPDPAIAWEALYDEPMTIVAGSHHPLANSPHPTWADTRHYPWIMPPKRAPLRRELELALAAEGEAPPKAAVETFSTLLITSLLQQGEMLAVMSRSMQRAFARSAGIVALPLPLQRRITIGVLRRRAAGRIPAYDDFLACVRSATNAGNEE